jgi:hypothetical protein
MEIPYYRGENFSENKMGSLHQDYGKREIQANRRKLGFMLQLEPFSYHVLKPSAGKGCWSAVLVFFSAAFVVVDVVLFWFCSAAFTTVQVLFGLVCTLWLCVVV